MTNIPFLRTTIKPDALFSNQPIAYDLPRDQASVPHSHARPLGGREATDAAGDASGAPGIRGPGCGSDAFGPVCRGPQGRGNSRNGPGQAVPLRSPGLVAVALVSAVTKARCSAYLAVRRQCLWEAGRRGQPELSRRGLGALRRFLEEWLAALARPEAGAAHRAA